MQAYEGWAQLELLGHRVRYGRVSEQEMYGGKLLRIDIPQPEGLDPITEFYGCSSIYAMTPMAEEICRDRMGQRDARPVKPVEYRIEDRRAAYQDED